MGKHTRVEFAQLTGLTAGNLSNYIKRGKILEENGLIDDKIYPNDEFLEKRSALLGEKPLEKTEVSDAKPKQPKASGPSFNVASDDDQTTAGLNRKRLKVDIAKKKKETDLLSLREQRIKSEIVPVTEVSVLFNNHTQSIFSCCKDVIEEMLIQTAEEARLSGTQLAKLRKLMIERLNDGIDRAALMTKKSMGIITDNFSGSKALT